MAKGSMLMGTSRGKLGNMVLARRNGKEIQRAYISKVANPKSIGQNYQRMVFATGAAALKALSGIVDHSFEGKKYGQDSRSYFMSEALKMLRSKMRYSAEPGTPQARNVGAYNIKGAGVYVPNAYKVAEGSLYVNPYVLGSEYRDWSAGVSFYDNELTMQEVEATISTKANYEALLSKMFGCAPGDQVTFLLVGTDNTNAAEFGGAYNKRAFVKTARIIFKEWSEGMSGKLVDAGVFQDTFIDAERSINVSELRCYVAGDDSLNVGTLRGPVEIISAACIISRPNGNSWKRSTSYMAGRFIYAQGPDVVASYGDSVAEILPSDYYLNNGLTSTTEVDTAIPAPEPEPTFDVVGAAIAATEQEAITTLAANPEAISSYPPQVLPGNVYVAANLAGVDSRTGVSVRLSGSPITVTMALDDETGLWIAGAGIELPTMPGTFDIINGSTIKELVFS